MLRFDKLSGLFIVVEEHGSYHNLRNGSFYVMES